MDNPGAGGLVGGKVRDVDVFVSEEEEAGPRGHSELDEEEQGEADEDSEVVEQVLRQWWRSWRVAWVPR